MTAELPTLLSQVKARSVIGAQRHEAVYQARKAGHSVRDIAAYLDLTPQRVGEIIRHRTHDRPRRVRNQWRRQPDTPQGFYWLERFGECGYNVKPPKSK